MPFVSHAFFRVTTKLWTGGLWEYWYTRWLLVTHPSLQTSLFRFTRRLYQGRWVWLPGKIHFYLCRYLELCTYPQLWSHYYHLLLLQIHTVTFELLAFLLWKVYKITHLAFQWLFLRNTVYESREKVNVDSMSRRKTHKIKCRQDSTEHKLQ